MKKATNKKPTTPAAETMVIDGCIIRIHYAPEEESVPMDTIQKALWEIAKAS